MTPNRDIIAETAIFRPKATYPAYPPYHTGADMEEYFFQYFLKNKVKTDRIYLPIYWTNLYNDKDNAAAYGRMLQDYFKTLDPNLKYFTVCQHDDAPREILPKNTFVFSGSGRIYEVKPSNNCIPIPLICSPIPKPNKNRVRDIFCSFIGSNTHPLRAEMCKKLETDEKFLIGTRVWTADINKDGESAFIDATERSIFTLCPRGYGLASFRLFEAMQLGSIPVYIYDTPWIPYEDELKWDDLCIFVHKSDIANIPSILDSISPDKIKLMRRKIADVYDSWFSLKGMCSHIQDILEDEKPRLMTFYSESHKVLYDQYFKPSVEYFNEYDLISYQAEQFGSGSFMGKGWKEAMGKKIDFIIDMINDCWGDYFVFADADVIFFRKTVDYLVSQVKNVDAAFQVDAGKMCAGFFIMKCNNATLNFMTTVKELYGKYPEDQTAMQNHVSMINYKLLPTDIFNISHINGNRVWDCDYSLKIPSNIRVFHGNWTIGIDNKIRIMNFAVDTLRGAADFTKFKISTEKKCVRVFNDNTVFTFTTDDNRVISGNYIKNKSVDVTGSTEKKHRVNLFYNYFESKNEERRNEINYCMNQFIKNGEIDNIYLLLSDPINIHGSNIIKIDILQEQPTYQDMFNVINTVSKDDDINIIINSDCYIDGSNVKLIKENIEKRQVYCLSRWDILSLAPLTIRHFHSSESQDAWVFIGKMSANIKADFKMGVSGCDNAIAYEFKRIGYNTLNPSKDIQVIHYHLSNVRTYGNDGVTKDKYRIRLPYHFIMPAQLDEKPIYQPQPMSGLKMAPTPTYSPTENEPTQEEITPAKLRIRQRFINK
jgi:hypothetical protein